jgi:putative SOS response-associated peptidase YedK
MSPRLGRFELPSIDRDPEEGHGDHPPAFTMLTTEPVPDVEPYHNRQIVVLRPENCSDWIYLIKPEAELLRPLPAGSLDVSTVRSGRD